MKIKSVCVELEGEEHPRKSVPPKKTWISFEDFCYHVSLQMKAQGYWTKKKLVKMEDKFPALSYIE